LITTPFIDPETLIGLDAQAFAGGVGTPMIDAGRSPTLVLANADTVAPTMAVDSAGAVARAGEVASDGGIAIHGGPSGAGTVGARASSMFQGLSTAVRVVAPISWAMTRTGAVHAISGADW
jgi:hypothetical protein